MYDCGILGWKEIWYQLFPIGFAVRRVVSCDVRDMRQLQTH